MPELGYSLSSEKFSASDLVRFARRAEEAGLITEDALAEAIVCSPDPEAHIRRIQEATKAGADHVYLHQVGRDQEGFFRFYQREVLPEFAIRSRRAA